MTERVLVAMSGGVDSSVAAALMAEAGFDCTGATMLLCGGAGERDAADAARTCERLGMPHVTLDMRARFEACVVAPFVDAYAAGRTPNPCIDCNRTMKFGALVEYAWERGFRFVATGHYARIVRADGRARLLKGACAAKDQSYVLCGLSQRQLAHAAFPLGDLSKEQVRAAAAERGLDASQRAESQDICFVTGGDYGAFVDARRPCAPGRFVDVRGNVLGEHRGISHYTVGQRKGVGVAVGHPVYVRQVDAERNEVVLGDREDLLVTRVRAERFNWIAPAPAGAAACRAKVRYNMREAPCVATPDGGGVTVSFREPVMAPAPGQALVLYDGDEVLGGGEVVDAAPTAPPHR